MDRDISRKLKEIYSKAEQKKTVVTASKAKNMLPYLSKFAVFNSSKVESKLNTYAKNKYFLHRSILETEFLDLILESSQKPGLVESQSSIQSISSNYSTKSTWTDSIDKFTDLMLEELRLRLSGYEETLKKILAKNDTFQAFDKLLDITKIKTTPQQHQSFVDNAQSILDYNEFITSVNLWFSKTRPEFMRISPVESLSAETYLLLIMAIARDYMIANSYTQEKVGSNSKLPYFTSLIGNLIKAIAQGNQISELNLSANTMKKEIKEVLSVLKMFENEKSYFLSRFYEEAVSFYKAQAKKLTSGLLKKQSVSSIKTERLTKKDRPRSNIHSRKTVTPTLNATKGNQALENMDNGKIELYQTHKKLVSLLAKYLEMDRKQDKSLIEEKIIEKRETLLQAWKNTEDFIDENSDIQHKFTKKSMKSELFYLLRLKSTNKKLRQTFSEKLKKQVTNEMNLIVEEWFSPIEKTPDIIKREEINRLKEFVNEYEVLRAQKLQENKNQISQSSDPIQKQNLEAKEVEDNSCMLSTFGLSPETKLIDINSDLIVGAFPQTPDGNESRRSPKFNFISTQDGHLHLSIYKESSFFTAQEKSYECNDRENSSYLVASSHDSNLNIARYIQNQETSFGENTKENLSNDRISLKNGNENDLSDSEGVLRNINSEDVNENRNTAIMFADRIKETSFGDKDGDELTSAIEENLFTIDHFQGSPEKTGTKKSLNITSDTIFAKPGSLKQSTTNLDHLASSVDITIVPNSDLSDNQMNKRGTARFLEISIDQFQNQDGKNDTEHSDLSSFSIQSPIDRLKITAFPEIDHKNQEKEQNSKEKLEIMLIEDSKITPNDSRSLNKNRQKLSIQLVESFDIQKPSQLAHYRNSCEKQPKSDRDKLDAPEKSSIDISKLREKWSKRTDESRIRKINSLNKVLSIDNLNDMQIPSKILDEPSNFTSTGPTDKTQAKKNPPRSMKRSKVLYATSLEDIFCLGNLSKHNQNVTKTVKLSTPRLGNSGKEEVFHLEAETKKPEDLNVRDSSNSENLPLKQKFAVSKNPLPNRIQISLSDKHIKSSWETLIKSNPPSKVSSDSVKPKFNTKIKDLVSVYKNIHHEKLKKGENTEQIDKLLSHCSNSMNPESKLLRNQKDFIDILYETYFKGSIDLGAFLQFCSDIHIVKNKFRKNSKELSNKLLLSLFDTHSNFQGQLTVEMLRLVLKRMAECYYDVEYDLIHNAKYSKLPASSKLDMLCDEIKRTIHLFKGASLISEE